MTMTTWGPSFKGTGSPPEGYVHGTPVQHLSKTGMAWTRTSYPSWVKDCEYRLPADHPFYKPAPTPEEAAVKLLTDLGYTGITPPDPFRKDRDFVADMWSAVYGEGNPSEINFRKGNMDLQVDAFMTFIRENKERI